MIIIPRIRAHVDNQEHPQHRQKDARDLFAVKDSLKTNGANSVMKIGWK